MMMKVKPVEIVDIGDPIEIPGEKGFSMKIKEMKAYVVKNNKEINVQDGIIINGEFYVYFEYYFSRFKILTDPSEFKKTYIENVHDDWYDNYCCFASEELASEYINAVNKYSEKWKLESEIDLLNKRLEEFTKEVTKLKGSIKEKQTELNNIIAKLY